MTAERSTVDVLLVEDDADDARFVEQCILGDQLERRSGDPAHPFEVVRVDRVERLASAFQRVREESPDVVLLDLTLPDSSGLRTLERMVEHAPRVPIVVLTGRDDAGIGVEAIQRGAQDYLRKADIGASLLRRTLRYAIERKRNQRELRDRTHRLALLNRIVRQDIRNDVSMIVGRGDQLRGSVSPEDEAVLEDLLRAASHTIDLVDTTGELMDVLSGDGVEPTPCDLDTVVEGAVAHVRANRTVDVDLQPANRTDGVMVYGSTLLESAVRHLLATAVDYADGPAPTITVAVEVSDRRADVVVGRSGEWLPEAWTEFLADSAEDPDGSRVGVGLYLVRTVLDAVDGYVEVDDRGADRTAVRIGLRRVASE